MRAGVGLGASEASVSNVQAQGVSSKGKVAEGCGGEVPPARKRSGQGAAEPPLESNYRRKKLSAGWVPWEVVVKPCNCGCRVCGDCGYRLGCRVRDRLIQKAGLFVRPKLFTLTIDRRRFGGPQEAHQHVSEGRYVARLLATLKVPLWAWVLEFQTKTGEGWPHWHILIDLSKCPKGRIDLKRAWEWWRDRWGLGGLDLSDKDRKFADATHAIHYITKYLIKQPEGGYPEWVLDAAGLKFVGSCRSLGPLVGDVDPAPPAEREGPKRKYPPRRSLLDRIAQCQLRSRLFMRYLDEATGEMRLQWLGDLAAQPQDVAECMPDLFRWEFEGDRMVLLSDGVLWEREAVRQLQDRLLDYVESRGLLLKRTEHRKAIILDDNAFTQRRVGAM